MTSTNLRKKHHLRIAGEQPPHWPEFLGAARIGDLECCYFKEGSHFENGLFEFNLSTLTLPKGIQFVYADGTKSAALSEPFVMPVLVHVNGENQPEVFPGTVWHYCQAPDGGSDRGKFACAKAVVDTAKQQIVTFYHDENGVLPHAPEDPSLPEDPNGDYYFLPLLLPNQNLCYYIITAEDEQQNGKIAAWNEMIEEFVDTEDFFIAIDDPFVFVDALQMNFTANAY